MATPNARELASDITRSLRDYPEMISVLDFARYTGLSRATIYKLVRDGDIKASRIRNAIRIHRDSACDYLGL